MPAPCSFAELVAFRSATIDVRGVRGEVEMRAVWVRVGRELLAAGVCAAAVIAGLIGISHPVPGGIALALLLMAWSLEIHGPRSPLSLLLPSRATQDLIAPDPRKAGGRAILLCARCDLPRSPAAAWGPIPSHLREFTWLAIALLGGICAARSLGAEGNVPAAIQLACSLGALALIAAAASQVLAPREEPSGDWSGLERALGAVAALDGAPPAFRIDLAVVGASSQDGVRRVLKQRRDCFAAILSWDHRDGDAIVGLVRSLDDS